MNRPTWNNFIGKNFDDNRYAMEALARLLFRTRYGMGDSLPYFKNHAGNETEPICVNGEVIGFQSKFFEDGRIDAAQILHSLETVCDKYPNQDRYIIYTNGEFGNPQKGHKRPVGWERIEQKAAENNIIIEWVFRDNVLDLVQENELAYNIFFNPKSHLHHLQKHVDEHNTVELKCINNKFYIGNKPFSFDRTNYVSKVSDCIIKNKSLIITGESGSGKSAIVKTYLESISNKPDYSILVLNATSFSVNNVNDIFNLHDTYSLADYSSYFEGFTKKIIIIDSAEKLLDIDNVSPIRIFVEHLKNRGWLFLFTCKENSITELTDKIAIEYDIDFESITIEPEEESYIVDFAKEHNIHLPQDSKLLREIRIPFYFARYSELSISDGLNPDSFKEKVWKLKVCGNGNRANQIKRELCLLDIVGYLQNSYTYIIPYENVDINVASSLVEADILGEYPYRGFYIRHDIYADWALEIIIKKKMAEGTDLSSFFADGASVQFINAFKRFFINELNHNHNLYEDVCNIPFNAVISARWKKAIYECIGRSDNYAQDWFYIHQDGLKADNYQRFNEFVDTLVVTCQYVEQYFTFEGKDYPIMKPTGSGWHSAVEFIWTNKDTYYFENLQTTQKLISNFSGFKKADSEVIKHAGFLALHIFDVMAESRKNGQDCWFGGGENLWAEIVCRYGIPLKNELSDRFNQIVLNKWVSHKNPYAELIDYLLKRAKTFTLFPICLSCRKEMLDLLALFWVEQKLDEDSWRSHHMRGVDYAFGLNLDFEGVDAYFPSSAYQTPIYTLLSAEEMLSIKNNSVLKFIIEFVDSRVRIFQNRGFANATIDTINVTLCNGSQHEVIVSECLWNLYRGTSGLTMPHIMECLHMALEKHLLELAGKKGNKEYVSNKLWYILENSHSCSLYSIVASIATAYSSDYLEQLLFLMQNIKFLQLDLMRYTREFHVRSIEFAYYHHKDLLRERRESNALTHRSEHLEQLLLKLQVILEKSDNKDLLDRVYKIVDNLKEQVSKMHDTEKALAKYIILRVDARSMQQNEVQAEDGARGIEYSTVLTPEMEKEQIQLKKNNQELLKGISLRQWIDYRYKHNFEDAAKYPYDKDLKLVFKTIRDIRQQLEKRAEGFSLLMGDQYLPFTASAVLLIQFGDQLDTDEKDECKLYLNEALKEPNFLMNSTLSGLEICLNAIPSLLEDDSSIGKVTEYLVTYSLIKRENYSTRPCDIIYSLIKKSELWTLKPNVMTIAIEKFKNAIGVEDYKYINYEQAESLLCLLTPNTIRRDLGLLCIEKMAEFWKPKDRHHNSRSLGSFDAAYLIADYWLYSPKEEIPSLVKAYKPYINGDLSHDNLVSSIVYECAQNGLYENFWLIWNELYDGMVNNTNFYYNSSSINSFLINPDSLVENPGDWFRIEKKDIIHFERVARDFGSHPSVIYSISKVFSTIGKKYQMEVLPIINSIVKQKIYHFEDSLQSNTIYYLEDIISNVFPAYLDKRKQNAVLNEYMVNILEFMQKYNSTKASGLLNQI